MRGTRLRALAPMAGLYFIISLAAVSISANLAICPGVAVVAAGADEIPFNFIAYGDTLSVTMPSGVSPLLEDIIDLYLTHDPELIIQLGDLAFLGGTWDQLMEFNATMTAVWDSGVPFYSAPGNHESAIGDWRQDYSFTNYTQYVHYEDVAAACGGTELYYSFDYGDVHFIILNTEDSWVDDVFQCSTEQMTWLQGDIANVEDDTFLVVAFHRPLYSVREARPDRWAQAETIRDEFHGLFLQHDVDLVLNGHDHHYYRSLRDGIYYVVSGGGGAPPAGVDKDAPAWQDGDIGFTEFHFCDVQVNSSHVTLDVHLLNGTTADSFTIPRPDTATGIPMELLVLGIGGAAVVVIVAVVILRRR
ncbi:MAG: metallophosphoesterase [Candidatus Thorarchaeota archaeon]|nr:MAG: metallophosphoesterase [Candidatus Thorarchaeota archaeon]